MYFFIEKTRKMQNRCDNHGIDYNELYNKVIKDFYENYSLPAFHEWGDGFVQGDASDIELDEAIKNVMSVDNLTSIDDFFVYLDKKFIEMIEDELENSIKEFGGIMFAKNQFIDYKETLENKIREFLEENYYDDGGVIGHDYSVFLYADEMELFEMVMPSSNWSFPDSNDARFRVVHLNNYEKAFNDFSDYVSENTFDRIKEFFNENKDDEIIQFFKEVFEYDEEISLDAHYKTLEFYEKMNLWETIFDNESIEEYNKSQRSETIESIIENIEWGDIEEWFNEQF